MTLNCVCENGPNVGQFRFFSNRSLEYTAGISEQDTGQGNHIEGKCLY